MTNNLAEQFKPLFSGCVPCRKNLRTEYVRVHLGEIAGSAADGIPVVADIINAYEKDAPKVDFEEKPEEANKVEEEAASGLTEYPVIGAEDIKK